MIVPMALFRAFWTSCQPERGECSGCRGSDSMLTTEWRASLEKANGQAGMGEYDCVHVASSAACGGEETSCTTQPPAEPAAAGTAAAADDAAARVLGQKSRTAESTAAESSGLQAVFATRGGPPPLEVAPEFDSLSLDHTQLDDCLPPQQAVEQRRLLQASLRAFTRSLLRGVCLRVLLDDGRTLFTEASLDSDLTHLVLHMTSAQRPVALKCIERICAPEDVVRGGVQTTNAAFLDVRCSTLLLQDGQFLTFVFDALRTREYFEMCLKVILMAKAGDEGDMPGRPCATMPRAPEPETFEPQIAARASPIRRPPATASPARRDSILGSSTPADVLERQPEHAVASASPAASLSRSASGCSGSLAGSSAAASLQQPVGWTTPGSAMASPPPSSQMLVQPSPALPPSLPQALGDSVDNLHA